MNDTEAHSPALGVSAGVPAGRELTEQARPLSGKRRLALWPASLAALVSALSLLLPLGWSGLWAPHELEMADFSRRIAVALHGAEALLVVGAENAAPTLSELGKGQLPFSSVAIGFQLLGLSDWAGRLPLALWALAGLACTYWLVSLLADRVAAAYAALALATTPLYFLHARTMLGDGVTLAASAIATAGLGLCVFRAGRVASWAAAGLVALVGLLAGFGARGVLLGVAVPALGVGLAWLIWRLSGCPSPGRKNDVAGALSLAVGLLAVGVGVWVIQSGSPDLYLELLGAQLNEPRKLPTHDAVLHQLGFGLFPWSAIAPFAVAIAFGKASDGGPRSALRLCLLGVLTAGLGLHGLLAPYVGVLPFVGTFAIAALIGVGFRDADEPELRTRLLALSAAALLIILAHDLRTDPGQSLRAYALLDASFPESFTADARSWLKLGTAACLLLLLLTLGDFRANEAAPRAGEESRRWLEWLRTARRGRLRWALGALGLVLGVLAIGARLVGRGVAVPGALWLDQRATLFTAAFALVPLVVFGPALAFLARDGLARLWVKLPWPRARVALLGIAAFGLALSLGYYPALAAHLSPRDVFESFRERAKPGEPLAVLGQAARVAPYYARAEVHTPGTARAGLDFLLEEADERRWLVFGAKDLAPLNQLYRQRTTPPANLPILDAMSSEVLLASSRLAPGEANDNPLAAWITSERPAPAYPLDVDLNGQLRCLGWALTDRSGKPVEEPRTGERLQFQIFYEVLAPVSGSWKTFIHIDGHGRRFNGDHDTLEGKYPFRYWQQGDFIIDVYAFELEPHFAGATYDVYFGLFSGDERMRVKHGKHHENRVAGGKLTVR